VERQLDNEALDKNKGSVREEEGVMCIAKGVWDWVLQLTSG